MSELTGDVAKKLVPVLMSEIERLQAELADAKAATSSVDVHEYASSCYLPTEWIELPLTKRVDHNHVSRHVLLASCKRAHAVVK